MNFYKSGDQVHSVADYSKNMAVEVSWNFKLLELFIYSYSRF